MLTAQAFLAPYSQGSTGKGYHLSIGQPRSCCTGFRFLLPCGSGLNIQGFAEVRQQGRRWRPRGEFWDLQGYEPSLVWWLGEQLDGPPAHTVHQQVLQRRNHSRARVGRVVELVAISS